jgi:hypothetical protein
MADECGTGDASEVAGVTGMLSRGPAAAHLARIEQSVEKLSLPRYFLFILFAAAVILGCVLLVVKALDKAVGRMGEKLA